MNEAFPKFVFEIWYFEFTKDNGPIAGGSAPNQNQILLGGECGQLSVRQFMDTRPHFGFVFVPVMTRLDHFLLDRGQHDVECLDRIRMRWMGFVQYDSFFAGYRLRVRHPLKLNTEKTRPLWWIPYDGLRQRCLSISGDHAVHEGGPPADLVA